MKRTYSKPEIMFESFTLSTNIAGNCEGTANTNTNYDSCGRVFGPDIIIAGTWNGCKVKPENNTDNYDGFCYHVPTEDKNLFNS